MKNALLKMLSLVLALLMVFSTLTACGEETEGEKNSVSTDAESNPIESEEETEKQLTVEPNNYDQEFCAIYNGAAFREGYYFVNQENFQHGDALGDAVYEREQIIEEYLGVDIVAIMADDGYVTPISNAINAGDDTYQLVMTHAYYGIVDFIVGNQMRDFQEFDNLQLTGDHWNSTLMQELAINDTMYCGYNDFCLASCYLVGFNKDMVEDHSDHIGDLYEHVRNKTWTLDKLIEYSALVSADDGDGRWTAKDTYGFSSLAAMPLISFQVASGVKLLKQNDEGLFYISSMVDTPEKIVELDEKIFNLMNRDATYKGGFGTELHLSSNRVLFELVYNFDLILTRNDDIRIGVLPYPLWDTNQEEYYSMNWGGVLMIPTTVENDDMVGDVIELLAWHSDSVEVAFYENLLGSKLANAPEDAEMLKIIWDSVVTDMGLTYCSSSSNLNSLLYAIPTRVTSGGPSYATRHKANARGVESALKKVFG